MSDIITLTDDANFLQDEFPITVKDRDNIIAEFDFGLDDEGLIMKAAIKSMEKIISDNIALGKVVFIPYIGRVRRSDFKDFVKERRKEISNNKKNLSSSEFKIYFDGIKRIYSQNKEAKDSYTSKINRLKKIFKKEYEEYSTKISKIYADLYIKSLTWFRYVPFDQEVQDQFDRLNNEQS